MLVFLLMMGASVALFVIGLSVIKHFSKDLPNVEAIRGYEPSQTTHIYASQGELIATLFKENRTYTKFEEIAPAMRDAIVAVEDSRFRQHIGVDFKGVARAALYDLQHKGAHQGASTITMQLARNLFLTPNRTLERKIREVLLSLEMEKKFTKDEILELYLNQIYYGSGAYGIDSAAKIYFGKKPSELTIAEASLLAGLPQAPSEFSPFVDEEAARTRQGLVLGRMLATGTISQQEHDQAVKESQGFTFTKRRNKVAYEVLELPYFTTYALRQLSERYSEELLYRGGLTIHTTVDVALQKKCERILREMISQEGKKLGADTGAIVLIENKTGYIRALVGGTGWNQENQFNRAWQARRQPGSTFKPVVYAAAVEKGWKPDSKLEDKPLTVEIGPGEVWKPKNSDRQYMGEITMATALKYSRNVAAARLAQKIGLESIIRMARRMGIKEDLPPHPSLALGSVEVTPLDMATAYTVFPNEGIGVDVFSIKRVVDARKEAVEEHTFANKHDVMSAETARTMVEMMKAVVEEGTATKAILDDHDAAGKTGTTDSFRDAWFVGFTRDYTAAVWVGADDNSQMNKSYGGDLPARIWKRVMLSALWGKKPTQFFPEEDQGEQEQGQEGTPQAQPALILTVCKDTRLRAQPGCPAIVKVEVMDAGEVDWCTRHSEQAPQLSEWPQMGTERDSTAQGEGRPAEGYDPNTPLDIGAEQPDPNTTGVTDMTDMESGRGGRETGRVRGVRPVGDVDSVAPVSGNARGQRHRSSGGDDGAL